MSFYMIMNSKIVAHEFHYLEEKTGRRLDQTVSPRNPNPEKADTKVQTWVADIMTRKLITLGPDNSVKDAVEIFKEKSLHHIPLIKDHVLVGIVSDRDVMWLDYMEMGKYTTLEQFMNKIVVACHEDTSMENLAKVFYREDINGMPVINDKNKLVGIVTHRDILRWVFNH